MALFVRHNFWCSHRMGEGMLTASGQLQTVLARSDCTANTSREAGGYAQWAWEKAAITGRRWRTMVFGRPSMQGYLASQVTTTCMHAHLPSMPACCASVTLCGVGCS